MPQTSPRKAKSVLLKLFNLDDRGNCVAEYPVDEECVVEFSDFADAVGDSEVADMQTFYLGEHKATVLHGDTLSLVAISRGQLGQEELKWSKATLAALESYLAPAGERRERPSPPENPPPSPEIPQPINPPSTSSPPSDDLSERERAIAQREKELGESEERAWKAILGENDTQRELEDLREKLADAESQAKIERRRLEREIEWLKYELAKKGVTPKKAERDVALHE